MTDQISTIEPNHFPTFIELLKQSWQVYKNRWKTIVGTILVPIGITILLIIPLIIFFMTIGFGSAAKSNNPFTPIMGIAVIYIIIFVILMILFQLWAQVSLLVAIRDRTEKVGTKAAYGKSKIFILRYFLLGIALCFVIAFGYILFVIPGIIFGIWFGLSYYVLVTENTGVIASMKKSKEYVSGKLVDIFYRNLLFGLFYIAAYIIFSIIPVVNLFSRLLDAFILAPLSLIFMFLIYENLKNLKGKTISNPTSKLKLLALIILYLVVGVAFLYIVIISVLNTIQNRAKNKTTLPISNTKQLPLNLQNPISPTP